MNRISFVLEILQSEQGSMDTFLPSCSKNLEQGQQAEALSHSFTGHRAQILNEIIGLHVEGPGQGWGLCQGAGLQESLSLPLLCNLIPGVPGVHCSCQIQAKRPPTLPSSLLPHSSRSGKISPCPGIQSRALQLLKLSPRGTGLGNHIAAPRSRCAGESGEFSNMAFEEVQEE